MVGHQQVAAPQLGLELLQLGDESLVFGEEGRLRLDVALDQALLDQKVAQHGRVAGLLPIPSTGLNSGKRNPAKPRPGVAGNGLSDVLPPHRK